MASTCSGSAFTCWSPMSLTGSLSRDAVPFWRLSSPLQSFFSSPVSFHKYSPCCYTRSIAFCRCDQPARTASAVRKIIGPLEKLQTAKRFFAAIAVYNMSIRHHGLSDCWRMGQQCRVESVHGMDDGKGTYPDVENEPIARDCGCPARSRSLRGSTKELSVALTS